MKRVLVSVVLLAVALVLQLTFVNRLPLPGAAGPDLVLLVVAAVGLCGSPTAGAVTGFCAGLSLDIAPPGSYLIGEYALVFCLAGYLCGRLHSVLNRSALLTVAAAMAVAAAGEALYAVVGLAVSDPQVTWPSVRMVLPSAAIYDVALTPFVVYLVMRVVRWAEGLGVVAAAQPADGSALLARTAGSGALPSAAMTAATVLGGAGLLGGAGWLAGPVGARGAKGRGGAGPRTPNLRQAATRTGDGWVGGAPRTGLPGAPQVRPARPGRAPRLRPGAGSAGSAIARPARAVMPRAAVKLRIASGGRRDGNLGRPLGAGRSGSANTSALRGRPGSGPPGSAFRSQRPGAAGGRSGAIGQPSRFRPDPRMRGGSSSGADVRPRVASARRVSLRLGSVRRHDGVLGGGALSGGGAPRASGPRPSLRLGSGRRGAVPRFRSGPSLGGHSALSRRAGKRARFGSGRSWRPPWSRSTVWRIGSKRTGGLR